MIFTAMFSIERDIEINTGLRRLYFVPNYWTLHNENEAEEMGFIFEFIKFHILIWSTLANMKANLFIGTEYPQFSFF